VHARGFATIRPKFLLLGANMSLAPPEGRRWHVRNWALAGLSRRVIAYLLLVEATAVVLTIWSVLQVLPADLTMRALSPCFAFLVLFAAFQAVSVRIERLRIRVAESHQIDMTSVWTFGAVVAVPPGWAALVAIVIVIAMARLRRRNGQAPHRQVFNASTVVLACLASSAILHRDLPALLNLHGGAAEAVSVATAIVVYTVVNTSLVAGVIHLSANGVPVRALFGTWEENALELATLCLGGLTGIAAQDAPWLAGLAVIPMYVLQRGALIKQLEVAATTDRKTGLLNAVTWLQVAQKELARAERERTSATALIIDMDHFKDVNDKYGHIVGDDVLKQAARCLTDELRDYDTIGRFGGEEFVALLPNVDEVLAASIANRVLRRIGAIEVPSPDEPTVMLSGFSASIGAASYPRIGIEITAVLQAADTALYEAKRAGRARLRFVDELV